jgi:two-component system, LytTR family, response regulator
MEPLRAYLVDDEYLALKRLTRLLLATKRVKIIGSTTDPTVAKRFLASEAVDVVFLDIQMPYMNAFELLAKLPTQPMVIFTTAYDQYALKAFEVNSIDYLLKPVDPQHLARALKKLEARLGDGRDVEFYARLQSILPKLIDDLSLDARRFPYRICSRVGERILLLDLSQVTHFFSKDKLIYASMEAKQYVVDYTIAELEQALRAKDFVRIHRATLINLLFIDELHRWLGGRMIIRMKDKNHTELIVARNYARFLKERLGLY